MMGPGCFRRLEQLWGVVQIPRRLEPTCLLRQVSPPRPSYLGLVPSTRQSAKICRHGPITKAANSNARWLLTQASQHLATQPGPLGVFFRRIARRKHRNVAVVAHRAEADSHCLADAQRPLTATAFPNRPRPNWLLFELPLPESVGRKVRSSRLCIPGLPVNASEILRASRSSMTPKGCRQ